MFAISIPRGHAKRIASQRRRNVAGGASPRKAMRQNKIANPVRTETNRGADVAPFGAWGIVIARLAYRGLAPTAKRCRRWAATAPPCSPSYMAWRSRRAANHLGVTRAALGI